jgi:biotin-(acetyl-CoA carboxylase) ligase
MGDEINAKLGVGFNLDNQHPTQCLNRILKDTFDHVEPWTFEQFIAKFLNNFEKQLKQLSSNKVDNLNDFIEEYQNNWLHS